MSYQNARVISAGIQGHFLVIADEPWGRTMHECVLCTCYAKDDAELIARMINSRERTNAAKRVDKKGAKR